MPKHIKKVKAKTDYLGRFREIRKIAGFDFQKDLRKTRNDNHFSKSEKTKITKFWNEYEPVRANIKNGSARIIKPRRRKGETEKQYKNRLKQIRAKSNPDFKVSPFVVAFVPSGTKIRFNKNEMVTRRKNQKREEYRYLLNAEDRLLMLTDPLEVLNDKHVEHSMKHPRKPAILIGWATNDFPWRLTSIERKEYLSEQFLNFQNDYRSTERKDKEGKDLPPVEISLFITHVIIRA